MVVETPGPLAEWKKEIGRIRGLVAPRRRRARARRARADDSGRARRARPGPRARGRVRPGRRRRAPAPPPSWRSSRNGSPAATPARWPTSPTQREKRSDLRTAFPWARTVVSVGLQYDTPAPYSTEGPSDRGWIARYAWGDDYHDVMKAMLERLADALAAELGPLRVARLRGHRPRRRARLRRRRRPRGLGQEHVPAPSRARVVVLPRRGDHRPRDGADAPRPDMCGTCTACLDACPTGALVAPYVLDATRCISYLTIEVKGAIPEDRREGVGRHVFGCDICQDVCPWNRRRRHAGPAAFAAREGLVAPELDGAGRRRARRGRVPRRRSAAARSSARSAAGCCATSPSPSATRATPRTGRCWSASPRTTTRSSASTRRGRSSGCPENSTAGARCPGRR